MKVLIAYDGSRGSEGALDDLVMAGLPDRGTAYILSVAEVWMPQSSKTLDPSGSVAATGMAISFKKYGERFVTEAAMFAHHAEKRINKILSGWDVRSTSTYGSPSQQILETADSFGPDLIVVGSHGHSVFTRFLIGSISQKVLTEASCSVRIARGKVEVDEAPNRLIIGFDGSEGAFAAVRSVAQRNWKPDTEAHIVIVSEPAVPSSIARFVPPVCRPNDEVNVADRRWFEELGCDAIEILQAAGVKAVLHIRPGSPKQVLIEEAERQSADCIFVGASSRSIFTDRSPLGSTSSAIAARAHCSVEVVRESTKTRFENLPDTFGKTAGETAPGLAT
jgi:nucleotide-binding universal stress UspA family protein